MPEFRQAESTFPQNVMDLAANDRQLQALMPLEEPLSASGGQASLQELMEAVMQTYAERPALGYRDYEIRLNPKTDRSSRILLPHFCTISYGELNGRIKQLAAAWGLHPQHRVDPGDFVCILGFTGVNHVIVDFACAYAQAVSVPLQTSLGGDLTRVFANTAPTCVAATVDDVVAAAEMAVAHPSIRSIIAFDYDPDVDGDREQLTAAEAVLAAGTAEAKLISLTELLDYCTAEDWTPLPPSPDGGERIALLLHSSGSTGEPKGAILTERLAARIFLTKFPSVPVIVVAFAPWNHRAGQFAVSGTLARGGTAYFTAKSDLSELFADIRLARPTELVLFPRVMEIIHAHFTGEVIRRSEGAPTQKVRAQVMAEMREAFLGDRISALVFGSAPVAPDLKQFMIDCFGVPLTDRYGTTELGSIMIDGRIARPPVIDYKLRDVPELGYFTTDKPYPRGELCVKTETGISGYLNQPEATAKLFDQDGYYRTGDILEERAPDELVYLDRVNDVLKLSQGEFIALGALGAIFEGFSPAIHQMYVHGVSTRPYLVAVVVPNMNIVEERLGKQPDEAALRTLLRTEMREAAAAHNLRSVEVPRDFIVEYVPFSFENGLLTSVRKRRRPALMARYGAQLEALYAVQEHRQAEELRALGKDASLSVLERVVKALEASLSSEPGGVDLSHSFVTLGGDSLGATGFAMLLDEIFGVEISVNTILSPAGNARSWAQAIEVAQGGRKDGLPTYAQIHGADKSQLHGKDLDIAAFLNAETIDQASLDPPTGESRCVLLTGATGYLGRFLCLEWLERLQTRNGRLICLVRAVDRAAALRRLVASFASDPVLAKRFDTLADGHLEILIGDVAEPDLGIDQETFDRLVLEVDHIVHCGALVNHLLPYAEMFGPNVVGTAQLVRLAIMHRQKRFDFISSIAVSSLLEPGHGVFETTPLLRNVVLKSAHAEGYACSKWASEHLLQSANAHFGLSVNIFRCGMILVDRRYAGQLNVPDAFTRLLYSVVMTGTAPGSFYKRAPDGTRQHAHYAGLPVDFVANAITGIGNAPSPVAVQTFHVTNQNERAHVSIDTFVDWIEDEGYPIDREDDHTLWLKIFDAKLKNLPEEQRQRSVLPVIASVRSPGEISSSTDNAAFVEAVSQLPMRDVPALDRALLRKYLADMRLLELIPEPQPARALVLPSLPSGEGFATYREGIASR